MKREQLAHLLRAASQLAADADVVVIGSQSILGSYDEDDLPDEAIGSVEADVAFWNDPENTKSDTVDGVLGEDSPVPRDLRLLRPGGQRQHGGPPRWVATATRPLRERVQRTSSRLVPGEPHDLAVAKLVAWREKDLAFVRALIEAGLLDCSVLRERAATINRSPAIRRRIARWVTLFDT